MTQLKQFRTVVKKIWDLPRAVSAYGRGYEDGTKDAAEALRRIDGYARNASLGGFKIADDFRSEFTKTIDAAVAKLNNVKETLNAPPHIFKKF